LPCQSPSQTQFTGGTQAMQERMAVDDNPYSIVEDNKMQNEDNPFSIVD